MWDSLALLGQEASLSLLFEQRASIFLRIFLMLLE